MVWNNPLSSLIFPMVKTLGGKDQSIQCLWLEGSGFRLGGIAQGMRAVPPFGVLMRLAVLVAWQKENWFPL